jgi:hypothetical protein
VCYNFLPVGKFGFSEFSVIPSSKDSNITLIKYQNQALLGIALFYFFSLVSVDGLHVNVM